MFVIFALIATGAWKFRFDDGDDEEFDATLRIVNETERRITVECQPFVDHDGAVYPNNRKKVLEGGGEWIAPISDERAHWIIAYFEPLADRSQLAVGGTFDHNIGATFLCCSRGLIHVKSNGGKMSIEYDLHR